MQSDKTKDNLNHYIIQLILLIFSIFLFSSKLDIIPWYMQPRTYDLLYILILLVIQFIVFLIYWRLYEKAKVSLFIVIQTGLHSVILFIMFKLCIHSLAWYLRFSIIFCIVDILLLSYTINLCKKTKRLT